MVMKAYGGAAAFAKRFNIPFSGVRSWKRIPYTVAERIHNDRPRLFTAIFCRPDLKWDKGKLRGSYMAGNKKRVYS
ncbi:hypothetical protein DIBBI_gp36 [Xanthomonas phage vB_XveM_DIBBI]|uniref:Uncharacterized protein n=1 Tax=Xanthomonas phage vB_XveM_DIBBI TaxID=1129194 RepID=I3PGW9_9CAUD|nr:hypothetical protein DIBBI_gp36 [Xanthomonas phage vB_XveM_DIBBI]AEX65704.1 hypothetical protein DIBBI_036 [Xanthomonas phage vB_XveM_DIBBI]